MVYYIRKVDTTQWEDELPAEHNILHMAVDGITNCCQTFGNTLSIWETSSKDPYSLENQKLLTGIAMALDRPLPFTFIFISQDELQALNLELEASLGDTPYAEVASSHRDIANLNLEKMGQLAWVIHGKVNDDDEMMLVAEEELKEFTKVLFPKVEQLPDEKKAQKKWRNLYQHI